MTKTVKLIHPFGEYPPTEYNLVWDEYCSQLYKWVQRWGLDWPHKMFRIHKDIVQWMSSYFEEVGEENRYFISSLGKVLQYNCVSDDDIIAKSIWNYYKTKEAAQAVADLRKHVYKFPMCEKNETCFVLSFPTNSWLTNEPRISTYEPYIIHYSSTEEDRAERLRLIENCIKGVGYLTI